MFKFVRNFLDIILPRKERSLRAERYSLEDLMVEPTEHELYDHKITTLFSYKDRATEDLIRALKYDQNSYAATLLAGVLAEYLREEIAQMKLFSPLPIVLVPVPLHKDRVRERGFNQIERVLEHLPNEFKDGTISSVVTSVLVRTRNTPQQTRLSRKERFANVEGAFALTRPDELRNKHVMLIDDVVTTGATMSAAARPLNEANITTTLLAIARA